MGEAHRSNRGISALDRGRDLTRTQHSRCGRVSTRKRGIPLWTTLLILAVLCRSAEASSWNQPSSNDAPASSRNSISKFLGLFRRRSSKSGYSTQRQARKTPASDNELAPTRKQKQDAQAKHREALAQEKRERERKAKGERERKEKLALERERERQKKLHLAMEQLNRNKKLAQARKEKLAQERKEKLAQARKEEQAKHREALQAKEQPALNEMTCLFSQSNASCFSQEESFTSFLQLTRQLSKVRSSKLATEAIEVLDRSWKSWYLTQKDILPKDRKESKELEKARDELVRVLQTL